MGGAFGVVGETFEQAVEIREKLREKIQKIESEGELKSKKLGVRDNDARIQTFRHKLISTELSKHPCSNNYFVRGEYPNDLTAYYSRDCIFMGDMVRSDAPQANGEGDWVLIRELTLQDESIKPGLLFADHNFS